MVGNGAILGSCFQFHAGCKSYSGRIFCFPGDEALSQFQKTRKKHRNHLHGGNAVIVCGSCGNLLSQGIGNGGSFGGYVPDRQEKSAAEIGVRHRVVLHTLDCRRYVPAAKADGVFSVDK